MIPQALELASLWAVAVGFAAGFLAVWLFDLFVNRWEMAGEYAAQRPRVLAHHRRRQPRGDRVTVLGGGTSAEEVVEGLAIGTGVVIDPGTGVVIGAAIALDNLTEGLSIGALVLAGAARGESVRRVIGWTSLTGAALLTSALLGWILLREAGTTLVGVLQAVGAGGMLYLTVSALIPPSEERQYEGSGALATGAGFLGILLLTQVV
jgi:ZIP family zinc transporter